MWQYQVIFQRWFGSAGFGGPDYWDFKGCPPFIDISIPLFWTYSPLMYSEKAHNGNLMIRFMMWQPMTPQRLSG